MLCAACCQPIVILPPTPFFFLLCCNSEIYLAWEQLDCSVVYSVKHGEEFTETEEFKSVSSKFEVINI